VDPLEFGLGHRGLGLDGLAFGLGRLALRIEMVRRSVTRGKGLLQLDLVGRRADRQALLQPASKLRVVRPLEDLEIPHGMPGKFLPKEDRILEEIVRSSPRRWRKPCTAMSSLSGDSSPEAPEIRAGSRWNQASHWSIGPGRGTLAAGREPGAGSNPPSRPAEIPPSSAGTSGEAGPGSSWPGSLPLDSPSDPILLTPSSSASFVPCDGPMWIFWAGSLKTSSAGQPLGPIHPFQEMGVVPLLPRPELRR
jgi:hypothetical protein